MVTSPGGGALMTRRVVVLAPLGLVAALVLARAGARPAAVRFEREVVYSKAGGHLACLLGTADKSAGLEGNGSHSELSSRVQAVVSFFGPTDLTAKTWSKQVEDSILVPFLGGTLEEKRDLYKLCSPLSHVS